MYFYILIYAIIYEWFCLLHTDSYHVTHEESGESDSRSLECRKQNKCGVVCVHSPTDSLGCASVSEWSPDSLTPLDATPSFILSSYCNIWSRAAENHHNLTVSIHGFNQIKFYFATNKITFYINKQNEKYCYVVVTWHILCHLPVTPKHKLRNDIYIIYTRIYTYPPTLICMTTDWGNLWSVWKSKVCL